MASRNRLSLQRVALLFSVLLFALKDSLAFAPNRSNSFTSLNAHASDNDAASSDDDDDKELIKKLNIRAEEINVEKTRDKLEEANKQSFLKRRPRKLPYEDARRWVQANLGCKSQGEYNDLVENGNLRTPYIPKRPEEYYTSTREWVSWQHFLTGVFDDANPSPVKPQSGIFD